MVCRNRGSRVWWDGGEVGEVGCEEDGEGKDEGHGVWCGHGRIMGCSCRR